MISVEQVLKEVVWVRSCKKDLKAFPTPVQDMMGYALFLAQTGSKHRAVYTVRFGDVVYVLHAFQKKSKKGTATPKKEVALIKQRLKDAEDDYKQRMKEG